MKSRILHIFFAIILVFMPYMIWAQPANDNCSGFVELFDCPPDGATAGTTVGATQSFAPYGCYGGEGDVWYVHATGPTDNTLNLTVTAGTLGGNVQVGLLVANCASLTGGFCNCPRLLVNTWCAPGAVTVSNYSVSPNTIYFIMISGSGAQGTFTVCAESSSLPPQPGQDCPTAEILCDYTGPITLPLIANGLGAINEGSWTGDCIGAERNSQWYQFTVSQSGSYALSVNPTYYVQAATSNWCGSPANDPCRGDDYDFGLYNITSTGCPAASTNVSGITLECDYSACRGSTGFANTSLSEFAQVAGTHYCNVDLGGSCGLNCTTSPQWNINTVTLTAGNRYALLVQNYTGSANGVTISMGGSAVIGPRADFNTNISGCDVTINNLYPSVPNYLYSWDFGDATSSTSSAASFVKSYSTGGSYTIALTVVDQLGCVKSFTQDIVVCPLPIVMKNFSAHHISMSESNKVEWITSSEINNAYFTLESSPDAISWKEIAVIPGAGNSNELLSYSFDDKNYYNLTYYRLKQTDYDGQYEYFGPISVNVLGSMPLANNQLEVEIYPNPARDDVFINFPNQQDAFLMIYDMTGRQIYSQLLLNQKRNRIQVSSLDKGTYFFYIESKQQNVIKKVVIN